MQQTKRSVVCVLKIQTTTQLTRRIPQVNQTRTDIFVRTSTTDDVSTIERHRHQSQEEARQYRGSLPAPEQGSRDASFVAGVGDTVFASLLMTEVSAAHWNITHVFVEPDAREIGIGDALIIHALEFLRREKAVWCASQAQPGDRALKNLFERHGLVAQTILVGRSLSDPSTEVDASQ